MNNNTTNLLKGIVAVSVFFTLSSTSIVHKGEQLEKEKYVKLNSKESNKTVGNTIFQPKKNKNTPVSMNYLSDHRMMIKPRLAIREKLPTKDLVMNNFQKNSNPELVKL